MKLIKLSEEHYVIVVKSEIKEGDYAIHGTKWYREKYNEKPILCIKNNKSAIQEHWRKITHSTQPLSDKPHYAEYGMLTVAQVEEAINGYSVDRMGRKRASEYANDKTIQMDYFFGYNDGFLAHKELVKDKLFTIEDIEKAYRDAYHKGYNVGHADAESSPLALTVANHIHKDMAEFIESLLPTEWRCCFSDGKLLIL